MSLHLSVILFTPGGGGAGGVISVKSGLTSLRGMSFHYAIDSVLTNRR